MSTITIDRDAAHDAAERELSKPIYPKEGLTDRISEWIDELIFKLAIEGSDTPGGWLTIAVLVTLVVVAIVVAIRLARRTMRTKRGADKRLFATSEFTAAEHRAAAERFAAEGNWSEAIKHRLRAIGRQLEENGVLNPMPGRTATELARDAAPSLPDLESELTSAAATFNDVAYGEQTGDQGRYLRIAELDERVRSRRMTSSGDGAPSDASDSWAQLQ